MFRYLLMLFTASPRQVAYRQLARVKRDLVAHQSEAIYHAAMVRVCQDIADELERLDQVGMLADPKMLPLFEDAIPKQATPGAAP